MNTTNSAGATAEPTWHPVDLSPATKEVQLHHGDARTQRQGNGTHGGAADWHESALTVHARQGDHANVNMAVPHETLARKASKCTAAGTGHPGAGRKDVSGSASAGPRHEDYLTVREDRHHRRQGRVTAKGSAECARIER